MALRKRGGIWYFRKMINGRLFRESTGFADRKAAERRANEIEPRHPSRRARRKEHDPQLR